MALIKTISKVFAPFAGFIAIVCRVRRNIPRKSVNANFGETNKKGSGKMPKNDLSVSLEKTLEELENSCIGAILTEGRMLNGNLDETEIKTWLKSLKI